MCDLETSTMRRPRVLSVRQKLCLHIGLCLDYCRSSKGRLSTWMSNSIKMCSDVTHTGSRIGAFAARLFTVRSIVVNHTHFKSN